MKRTQPKKTWTPGNPLPKFGTLAEEESFWLAHDFDDMMEARGEGVVAEPQPTRRPRHIRAPQSGASGTSGRKGTSRSAGSGSSSCRDPAHR